MENEELILGYQWSPVNKEYRGEYRFPNNKDKDEIHIPPFTTLTKPPTTSKGYTAFWNDDDWIVVETPLVHQPIEDYASLRQEFIDYLKEEGSWTDEDEKKYHDSIKEMEDQQNKFREEPNYYDEELRFIRNDLLIRSDWTQLPDVQEKFTEEEKQQWIAYRQKLRDLPDNIEDPKLLVLDLNHPDWPISPT
jgi:hypothetical protein